MISLIIIAYFCISHFFFVYLISTRKNKPFKWNWINCYFWPGILLKPILSKFYNISKQSYEIFLDIYYHYWSKL